MTFSDNLTLIGIVTTAIGSIAAVIGILFIWLQVRASQKIAKGEFLLHLSELLQTHEHAYRSTLQVTWKPGEDDVSDIEMDSFLRVFENIKVLIDYGMIEFDVFARLYGYRVLLLVLNDHIYHDKLIGKSRWWADFTLLCKALVSYDSRQTSLEFDGRPTFVTRVNKLIVSTSQP